jgi:hypothetical protein
MKIFELSAYHYSNENLTYPIKVECKKSFVLFSSIEYAKKAMNDYLTNPKNYGESFISLCDDDVVIYFKIQEKPVDSYSDDYVNQDLWFDSVGNLIYHDIDQVFNGRENPKYKIGELVQFFEYDQLKLGIVYAQPLDSEFINKRPNATFDQTDDVYLIDELEGEHSHINEAFIGYPVYPLNIKEKNAYDLLRRDVLERILNKDNRAPKNIKIED